MKKIHFEVLIMLLGTILFLSTTSQAFAGDHQRKREAEKLFVNKKYAEALPLFAQLVANHPENYKFNYYYGVCLLIADKDKQRAVEFMETSLKNPKSPEEVYYYLSKGYHFTYMFDEGIRAISEFNKIVKQKQRDKFKTGEVTEYIYNAKNILDSSRNNKIIEMVPATSQDFFSKYAFEGNYGKMLAMPDDYKTKKDDDENPTIFLSAAGNVMFYSAYAKESGSRDIYKVEKDLEGNWSKPQRMDLTVNSGKDELFPTCSADGNVLYFSSMGHNSTGGFDIFKSVYSRVENKWSKPENMGSPYNSPFDDFNFMASGVDQLAYFTSNRNCGWGELMVCKTQYLRGEQLPIELRGKFVCINNPDMKTSEITVTRVENDSVIAIIKSDPATGNYNMMLPCAGTYRFKVEAEGYMSQTQVVTFSEFGDSYFVQEIYLSRSADGTEDLAISNLRESDVLKMKDNMLTAVVDENGSAAGGITAADMAPAATAGGTVSGDANAMNSDNAAEAMEMTGMDFRVQVGAFKHQTLEETRTKLAKKSKRGAQISNHEDTDWKRFYIGHESSYEKAEDLKKILKSAGFKGVFIVAFKDDQPVPMPASAKRKN